ncbi:MULTISPECIES: 3-deoxy-manno-octulosonate cytidylyltransferase [Roseomonadaceae]|uniref:3-deoxy-manno-octulosonate cytidylyltransferase n=1 Tax=Falsiroseomonas oleicola TaxID=2801474 RepID=A0ABS6HEX0_9PROT|nr:3-deoxy-manno-octulosonate cytidylyltransferase [Roseomonas oleicola]MBU8547294.1 3-deoxy-manno-octulosonate cytidylyltransferase [Roseomonas oleicola]
MNPIVLIPARLSASRLPGKPLADIHGTPMIVHVWRRAIEAAIGEVVVATDASEIAQAIQQVGGRVQMTRIDHPSGSDRIHEALQAIDPDERHDVVINLQGDLPTIAPAAIRAVLTPLHNPAVDLATLVAEIHRDDERTAPSVVKMVGSGLAPGHFHCLYFTRATAPWGDGPLYHHIGLYGWRRSSLDRFVTLPPSPLELREKLEQLRALEAGMRIEAIAVADVPLGVDTPADLQRARDMLA